MIYNTLKRTITRGNYTNKEDLFEKISLLYTANKITDEEYMVLMELLYEGGEE